MDIKSRALAIVVAEMEKDAIIRKGESGNIIEERAAGIIAVPNSHGENRGPQGGLPEPFDHDHLIIMNTAIDKEGNYYSLDNSLIAKRKAYYNQLYSSLITEMDREELGFETEAVYVKGDDPEKNPFKAETERGVLTHTVKVPEKMRLLVEAFSQRSKEIQQDANEGVAKYLEEHHELVDDNAVSRGDSTHNQDTDSVQARALAQLRTKNNKTDIPLSELQRIWREVGKELGITADDLKSLQTFKDANKNRKGLTEALQKEGKSMKQFERDLIESYHDYSKQPATREEAAIGFFVRKLVSYTNRRDAERLAEEIFDRHFIGCLEPGAARNYAKVQDKSLPLREQEDAQLRYKKDILYMDKVMVENEKRMINGWESRRSDQNFLIATDVVLSEISTFNAEIRQSTIARFAKESALQTEAYLASIDDKKRAKAIKNLDELSLKVDAIKELETLEIRVKGNMPQAEKMETLKRIAFLKNDDNSPLPKLSSEQVNAILSGTTKTGGLCIIEGLPGTGKSFASKVIKEVYRKDGANVIAVGTSALNTENLRQNIGAKNSSNIAQLLTDLESGKRKLSGKDVIIADEMGMCDLRMWIKLSDHINRLPEGKRPKLIAMGQTEQLTPVGVGQGFTTLSRKNFNTSTLRIVNRQEEDWQRQMTQKLSDGLGNIAIRQYYDKGMVNLSAKNIDGAVANAVDGYFNTEYKDKVVITDTNEVADKLNVAIRERIRTDLADKIQDQAAKLGEQLQTGEIGRAKHDESLENLAKDRSDLQNQVSIETKDFGKKEFMAGDKVMFLGSGTTHFNENGKLIKNHREKKTAAFGLKNGEQAVVVGVDPKKNTMTVRVGDGTERTLSTAQKLDISHGYSYSIYKSQGQSLDYVGVVISKVQSLNSMLVALSRHKKDMGIFLNDELKGEGIHSIRSGQALPDDVALIKKYVKFQQVRLKDSESDIEHWSYGKAKNFIERHGVNELFGIEKHPLDEFENLLMASTVQAQKKTTLDYHILETRTSNIARQIDRSLEERAKLEAESTQHLIAKASTGDKRTDEERRKHYAEDGQESLSRTSGIASTSSLSSIKSIGKEQQEAIRKNEEEKAERLAEAAKQSVEPKSKKRRKSLAH